MKKNEEKNKCIVLGAGISGIASTKLLIKHKIDVILYDDNKNIDPEKIKKDIYGKVHLTIKIGELSNDDIEGVKLTVISPGFPKVNPAYQLILNKKIPIISELELGYIYGKGDVCAITGSNGKTTTTELIGQMLKKKYSNIVEVVGNIGTPYTERVLANNKSMKYVIECSSFQLEDIASFKPKVATILNLSPDHLDRYNSYTDYINAKMNIAMNMKDNETLILNYEDQVLRELALNKNIFKCKIVFFSSKRALSLGFYLNDGAIYYKDEIKTIKLVNVEDLKLIGKHNYENIMAAIASAYYMGVTFVDIVESAKDFVGLPHRIEFVREKSGVKYYNDSKGTNPDATIKAIDAINGKIILIAGGRDKGVDYGDLIVKVKERVRYMILIGEAKKAIAKKARDLNYNTIIFADTLDEAVEIANSYSNVGDSVLLSPACSSFDMFKGYEERGDKFKAKVKSIK